MKRIPKLVIRDSLFVASRLPKPFFYGRALVRAVRFSFRGGGPIASTATRLAEKESTTYPPKSYPPAWSITTS